MKSKYKLEQITENKSLGWKIYAAFCPQPMVPCLANPNQSMWDHEDEELKKTDNLEKLLKQY